MTANQVVTIAVDAMGGDWGSGEIVEGVLLAARDDASLRVILAGDEESIRSAGEMPSAVEIEPAAQVIEMSEHPARALKEKPNASVAVAARLVKEGRAGAFVSAGNTGATMAAALFHLGRIPGVARPAIAVVTPTSAGPVVLLDAGANADTKVEYMGQFAQMGSAYASCLLAIDNPRVGLLNIGEEKAKGSIFYQSSYELLAKSPSLEFVGNVEGRDFFRGRADVVVADGFTGNVVLKIMEGLAEMLFSELKAAAESSVSGKMGGALLSGPVREMRARFDYEEYGGAQLLGVRGGCVIAHGSSRAKAIANAVRVAATMIRSDVVEAIARRLGEGGTASEKD